MTNKQNHRKVLILGHDTRSFLSVIRSLGRYGCEVHAGDCPPNSPALFSRYIKKIHFMPEYGASAERWKKTLTAILEKESFDLVVPCHDENIIPLQSNRAFFEKMARIYLLDDSVFELASNKCKATMHAQALGIPVPNFVIIKNEGNVGNIKAQISFPAVMKPVFSFTADNIKSRNEVRIIRDAEEFSAAMEFMPSDQDILLQEYFEGRGTGVEVLARDGEILFAFQHIRIHESPLGVSAYRKSVPLNGELFIASQKLLKSIGYSGVAMLEFKVNERTKEWKFIEINGRFWGSLPLAVSAGADFPRFLYEVLLGKREEFIQNYKTDIYCRNLTMDID